MTQGQIGAARTPMYTVVGIDAAIEREAKQRKPAAADSATKKTRP